MMYSLKKLVATGVLFLCSCSAFAFSCVPEQPGDCLIAIEKNDTEAGSSGLIDTTHFLAFCKKNYMYCYADNNGNTNVIGRYLADDVYILRNKASMGPDVILENKAQAEQFVKEFNNVTRRPAYFYIKHGDYPVLAMVAVGYREENKIKLLFLPNVKGDTGEGHLYEPVDMESNINPWK